MPFEDFPDVNLYHYTIQQNLYRYMLEQNYDLKISTMRLVQFVPGPEPKYQEHMLMDIQDRMNPALRIYREDKHIESVEEMQVDCGNNYWVLDYPDE